MARPSEVHHMNKWQNPRGHRHPTFTIVLCQRHSHMPQGPQIFQWLAHGTGTLYCSQSMWVILSRNSITWKWQVIPHSLYASGTYNIKCHRYNLSFYITMLKSRWTLPILLWWSGFYKQHSSFLKLFYF